ncbi:hypothetical protein AB4189_05880 [Vibrio sp. 10N.286.49.E1]|uniref:hypothetical protein n=1 Tax=unclassified Vibrio TaxID=2614977 RepID=UPI00354EFAC5
MIIQKLPLRLSEINELLIPSSDCRQPQRESLNYRKHQEAEYLAEILWKLELNGSALNRNLISDLHSGKERWADEQGVYVSIAETEFEFAVLEKLGLIFFENDWLNLTTRNLPDFLDVDGSIVPVLRFLENIKQILTGDSELSNLEPLKLKIKRSDLYEIVGEYEYKFTEHKVNLTTVGEYFFVDVQGDGWGEEQLLNQYFWKLFLESECNKNQIKHFFSLDSIFPDLIKFPQIKLYDRYDSDNFEILIKECTSNSFLLRCSISEFITLEETKRNFIGNVFKTIDKEGESEKLTLVELINYYDSIQSSSYELEKDILPMRANSYYYKFIRSINHNAIIQLASDKVYVNYSDVYVDDLLNELLLNINDNPLLKFFLLYCVHTTNNNYALYLLSSPSFFKYGYKLIKRNITNKYRLHVERDIIIIGHIISLVAESCIATTLNNNSVNKLAIFLCDLIKDSHIKELDTYDIDHNLFDEIFNQLKPSDAEKVIKYCVEYLNITSPNLIRNQSELYLIFNLLKCFSKNKRYNDVGQIHVELNNLILNRYREYFEKSSNTNGYSFEKDLFYDTLPWGCLSEQFCNDFLELQPKKRELHNKLSDDNFENKIQFSNSISNYLQILNNLVKVQGGSRDVLISNIIYLITEFGFESEDVRYPLVYDKYKSTFKEEYCLLVAISKNFHYYRDADFERLLDNISNIAPLSSMLILLENAQSESRNRYIQNLISSKSYTESGETSITNIESSYNSAIMTNNLDLAKIALSQAHHFFEFHHWKDNIEVRVMMFQWDILEYKLALVTILNSELLPDQKEKSVNDAEYPEPNSDIKNHHKTKSWEKEAKLFKSYIIGLIIFSQDPERATKIFEYLKESHPNTIFPHLHFITNIKWLESKSSTSEEFKLVIKDYEDSIVDFNFENLSLGNKADYLSAIFLSEQYTKVEQLCELLDIVEKSYKPIAITYCRSLQKNGNDNKAKQFVDNYKLYHGLDSLDEEFNKEVENIDKSILNRFDESMSEKLKYQFMIGRKDNDELRTIFNEIRVAPVNDLSEIIPSTKLDKDKFLYEEVLACAKVIRSRAKNLEVEIERNDENLINSWIVSIFNARLNRFGISIDEQKFIGESSPKDNTKKPKTSGSADGVIMDQTNEQLALFEGLNLNSVSTSTIDSHYDKLNKYDLIGLSPMFLVSYCYFKNDFRASVDDYIEHVEAKDYYDFDRPDDHTLEVLSEATTKHLVAALEYRNRGPQRVAIYHILIDMKLPSQEKS